MAASLQGVYIPLVTPFLHGEVDFESYRRLVTHYRGSGISGIVPVGTTGEAPTVEEEEAARIVEATLECAGTAVSVYVGISAASTRKALHAVQAFSRYPVEGFLVTSPYYNLPSQQGIYEHFRCIAESTDRKVLIYNIPYRTGRNVENETILRLSRLPNIAGIKDSCGIVGQSIELLRERDPAFSVLTGEDVLFYFNLVSGGNGGILAAAHVQTERFVSVCRLVRENNHRDALKEWNTVSRVIPLLFREPNPGPLKYLLARKGLIRSEEVRLPLAPISDALKRVLDQLLADGAV
ncbi:MAG TPA: 4-hydroxy-tetrahydrodipicolinate synthase [Spirochaetia bacterium]|nr:4-hydroxy-tetrahydrodipicolinate synthase [Spirochaetia bacterium]